MGSQVCTKVLSVSLGARLLPHGRLSDHGSFWEQGYNGLMVTDTLFLRNPHYLRMSDTLDILDLPFFCAVVNGLDGAQAALSALNLSGRPITANMGGSPWSPCC